MKHKNKSIKQILKKPSDALKAVIKGIKTKIKDDKFRFDMGSYGGVNDKVCYGCLATSTIHTKYNLGYEDFKDDKLDMSTNAIKVAEKVFSNNANEIDDTIVTEFNAFEDCIDSLRVGNIAPLLRFYGVKALTYTNIKTINEVNDLVNFPQMGCYDHYTMISSHHKEMITRLTKVVEIFKGLNM